MNKNRVVFVVLALLVLGLPFLPGIVGVASAVPIPEEINLFVQGLIFAAVAAGFRFLFDFVGIDLRDYTTPIAGVLSGWVLLELQDLINLIPATFDPYVSIVFKIIVVILGGIGTLYVLAKQRSSPSLL